MPVSELRRDKWAREVTRCAEAGMDGHLAKPLDRKELQATLALPERHRGTHDLADHSSWSC